MIRVTIESRVPFHDADPAGVAWHGRYTEYFELARCALMERIGYSYHEMVESGYVWPVVDLKVRYLQPLYFHDTITVAATLAGWEYRLDVDYEIVGPRGVATRGSTRQVAVDRDSGELFIGCPPALLAQLKSTEGFEHD